MVDGRRHGVGFLTLKRVRYAGDKKSENCGETLNFNTGDVDD